MPLWQQKSARKDFERYLIFGPNHILVTFRWNYRRSPGQENVCRWFLNRYKKLLGPSKLRNGVFIGKCSKLELKFSRLVKSVVFRGSETTKWLAAKSAAYALRNQQSKLAFIRENEKKYLCKRNLNLYSPSDIWMNFFLRLMTFHCMKIVSYI